MTTEVLTPPAAGLSPRTKSRLAGVFEFLEGTGSSVGQVFILGTLVVQGDAAATAHNILTHESLFRFGFLVSVAGVAFHLAWALLIWQLMRVVNRTVASVAAFFVITCCAVQAVTALLYLAPLLVLQGGSSLSGFSTEQTQALASAFLKVNGAAFNLDLVLFGLWCILTGYLIWKSTFLPRILGALLVVDGIGWTLFAWPPLATILFPAIAVASGLAEIPPAGVAHRRGREQRAVVRARSRRRAAEPGEDLVAAMTVEYPTRRVEVSFVGTPPRRQIERASGVSEVEIDGRMVRCLVAGSFQPFLDALRGYEVISLSSVRFEGCF